ncbi:phosphotransferase family protein [Kineosporia succinea]|uniref:Aminoglycoside phosphotransferase (APT) family kinase protein n=1 Tax=Kineosporia succinea TaxID=84632 RepID=A0ABT9NVU9_9ACTN|nr:phosphotransferase [Kineosporia succinea]MDP9824402.1 aminoglycoside phosphotransferase (APT) family kinase protein [Kineosporia succinea]
MGETKLHTGLGNPLLGWLTGEVLPGEQVVEARPLEGGVNHEMVAVSVLSGDRYVVRRYRRHNPCALELALAQRLAGVVPSVEVVGADLTGEASGEPTLVYRYVDGEPLDLVLDRQSRSTAAESETLGRSVGQVLAQFAAVGFAAPGAFREGSLEPDGTDVLIDPLDAVDRALAAGHAARVLTGREQRDLLALALASTHRVDSVAGARQLVHMDFNPKNLVVHRVHGRWEVAAVLDWEFAFSGSPLTDVGNMLRFSENYPREYVAGFHDGYVDAGGVLPPDWFEISRALDLFTLADILAHPPEGDMFSRVAALVRRRLGDST